MRLADYINSYDPLELRDPFVIAEAGVNHEGNMDLALRLIDEAREGGAQAIKFQTYKAGSIASKDSPSYWDTSKEPTRSQYELFRKYDRFNEAEYIRMYEHCEKVGIEFLSTPFDVDAARYLDPIMGVFKISSSDITNIPFIRFLCSFDKPILLSTGASDLNEIKRAVRLIENEGVPLSLMHCVLNYPTEDQNAHLGMIRGLRLNFPHLQIGYSDHTLPKNMQMLVESCLLGAEVIEKHFTHDKSLPGNDHYHAMDKEDLKLFWNRWNEVKSRIGSYEVHHLESEAPARSNARRSLVAARDLSKGHIVLESDLTWKRPASGISPVEFDQLVGSECLVDIAEDTILQWDMFDRSGS